MKRRVFSLILIPFLLFYALPAGAAEKEERTWQDESIYFLMIDRFNNGDQSNDYDVDKKDPKAYQGGDFQGVIDQLDYIKDMGFTSIWLTPVFDNQEKGYHGYWIKDFYNTDEHFGSMEKFKELVDEAHKRDMKVILDFIVNHVGPNHEWLNDPEKEDWFHENQPMNFNDEESLQNDWLYDLPDLNTENPEVKQYLLDAAAWWIEETDIDGYRLDTVRHVPQEFWKEFSERVKAEKEDFYLLGEVFDYDTRNIAKYEGVGIDGFADFPQAQEMRDVFQKPDTDMDRLFNFWQYNQTYFENPYLMGTFIDNHDMVRFTNLVTQNNQFPGTRWKLPLAYMFTVPGLPILYYGSEIALSGGEDPDNRRLMDFRTDKELVEYITKLGELRNSHTALTRGSMELLYEEDGMAVFKREDENETLIVAINNTSESQSVKLKSPQLPEGMELRGLVEGDLVRAEGDSYDIILDREKAEVYTLQQRSGLNYGFIGALSAVYIIFLIFIYYVWKKGKARKNAE